MVAAGEWWWVPDEEQCFVPAEVVSVSGKTCALRGEDGVALEAAVDKLTVRIDASAPGRNFFSSR